MTHTDDARAPGPYHHDPAELDNEEVAHEHSDVNIRAILWFAAGLVIVAIAVHVLMALMFKWMEDRARKSDPQLSPLVTQVPEMPRSTTDKPEFGYARGTQLLTNEPSALRQLRDKEDKSLHGYGWVEGKPGVAHMPIEEAKKLILERGVPARAGEPLDPTLGIRAATMGEASSGRTIPTGRKATRAPAAPTPQPAKPAQGGHEPGAGKH